MSHEDRIAALTTQIQEITTKIGALPAGTVGMFLEVLKSKLVQYDKRQEAAARRKGRSPNIYALAHYMKAHEDVQKAVKSILKKNDKDSLETLKKAIHRYIHVSDMPPAKATIKQIDQFIETGKKPSLVRKAVELKKPFDLKLVITVDVKNLVNQIEKTLKTAQKLAAHDDYKDVAKDAEKVLGGCRSKLNGLAQRLKKR